MRSQGVLLAQYFLNVNAVKLTDITTRLPRNFIFFLFLFLFYYFFIPQDKFVIIMRNKQIEVTKQEIQDFIEDFISAEANFSLPVIYDGSLIHADVTLLDSTQNSCEYRCDACENVFFTTDPEIMTKHIKNHIQNEHIKKDHINRSEKIWQNQLKSNTK